MIISGDDPVSMLAGLTCTEMADNVDRLASISGESANCHRTDRELSPL